MSHRARVNAVFFVSVADIFIGVAAVLLILIVLSAHSEDPRMLEQYDAQAFCSGSSPETLQITLVGEANPLSAEEWLALTPIDLLFYKWLIRPVTDDIQCYLTARQLAFKHNRLLESRGATQAVLGVEFWSVSPEGVAKDG